MRRHNPMRVPDSHLPKGLAAASSSSNKTEAVLPIIKKVLFFSASTGTLPAANLNPSHMAHISRVLSFVLSDGECRSSRAQMGMRRGLKLDLQRSVHAATVAGQKCCRYSDWSAHGLRGRGRSRSCRGTAVRSFFWFHLFCNAYGSLFWGVIQRPDVELAPRLHSRNLCIDGGYEICAEMYNKNILAPLATFIPKVRTCCGSCYIGVVVPPTPVHVQAAYLYLLNFKDLVHSGAIYRVAKDRTRERAEGGLRICRKRYYHSVVSLVSFWNRRARALPPRVACVRAV
jgi:hypothetical protein